MGSLSSDIVERVHRFFGSKPGDTVDQERAEEMARVAWWMVESDAAKKTRPMMKQISHVIGSALPEPQSPIEVLLAVAMAHNETLARQFEPQFAVGPYLLDFGFKAVKLAVECDGADYHREPGQVLSDQRRSNFLTRLGWRVIRFQGWEIKRSAAECAARVARYFEVLKAL